MPQVTQINFCLLHAHLVAKYMLSIERTWSVICCGGKHAGLGKRLLYFKMMLHFKYKNKELMVKRSFANSALHFNHQFFFLCHFVKLTEFKLPVST